MSKKKKKKLIKYEIIDRSTNQCIKEIDVSGKDKKFQDKCFDGLIRNFNFDNFFIYSVYEDETRD